MGVENYFFSGGIVDRSQIIQEIFACMMNVGGQHGSWYVGVTADPKRRLFTEHNVNEKLGNWIHRTADTAQDARGIEEYFLNILQTDGGLGSSDETARTVYAYKKAAGTKP